MMKALIVGVRYKEMNYDLDNSLIELEELCKACNIEVIKDVCKILIRLILHYILVLERFKKLKDS